MEAFKIALFEQEYGCPFPLYRTLSAAEGLALQARLASQLGLMSSATGGEVVGALASRQTYYPEANAEEGFALLPMLVALGIVPQPELFLNWGRFETVDAFQTTDVAHYFNDLWYPVADDLDVFDANLDWVVSIRHDGVVSFLR